ncbi:alcohol dehydrogenase catalytic domain-containing protein [Kribbella solani]|uniref:zinc-dependent alcohol dehydrogenase n=1 Tax=Kribbella solani TaxID=236067 RepID=UPI0029A7FDAC|nr:alcohol dehydrogenase catalytic domain-containing protein [Kribbella solani]MDX2974058.1 alcohol dehydrogenase catalytic domain-containing protein [Kribbella solani]MDX3000835.1 alcohol dehydrogenase catalytic domain-containing protein [Kribbella solani]
MRAFVIDGPRSGSVRDVPEPKATGSRVVVDVETVGLCGTDVELFAGTMPYFRQGLLTYPVRPGHEWAGTVREIGPEVTSVQPGDRVTGDTFVGCGTCELCRTGRHHLCPVHDEIGVRDGLPGALAERIAVPEIAVHKLPPSMSAAVGAFIEPGSCALRGVRAARVRDGAAVLVWGTGTLGLLAAQFARALGASVCVAGVVAEQLDLARRLGFDDVVRPEDLGGRQFVSVIDATGSTTVPGQAMNHIAPGGVLALLGVAPEPGVLDVNRLVLNDISAIGVLGGSACIDDAITLLQSNGVDVHPMIAGTVALDQVAEILCNGGKVAGTCAPKVQVAPSA